MEQIECCSSVSVQSQFAEVQTSQEAGLERKVTGCFALSWKHPGNLFC